MNNGYHKFHSSLSSRRKKQLSLNLATLILKVKKWSYVKHFKINLLKKLKRLLARAQAPMLILIMFVRGLRAKDKGCEINIIENYLMVMLTTASARQKTPSLLEMKNCRVVSKVTHGSQTFKVMEIAFPSQSRKYNQLVSSIELHNNDTSSRSTLWKD